MNFLHKKDMKKIFLESIPIAMGYMPLGFICGVFLQSSGFTSFQVTLISLLVFGGSAQFIAASMVGSGASIISIVLAVFASNLRQMLYTSSLSTYIDEKNPLKLMTIAHCTTDEVYAVNSSLFQSGDWTSDEALWLGILGHIYWIISNTAGGLLGDVIDMPVEIASFTLIAMFMTLIVLQIDSKLKVLVAIITSIIALVVMNFYRGNLNIIITSLIGATIGYILDVRGDSNG